MSSKYKFVQFYVSSGRFWYTVVFIYQRAQANSNTSSREDYIPQIPQILTVLLEIPWHVHTECIAVLFTRVHCVTNNSNKNTRKFGGWEHSLFAAQTQSLCVKFSTAGLEVLPNLRHKGVFQMSMMVNFRISLRGRRLKGKGRGV